MELVAVEIYGLDKVDNYALYALLMLGCYAIWRYAKEFIIMTLGAMVLRRQSSGLKKGGNMIISWSIAVLLFFAALYAAYIVRAVCGLYAFIAISIYIFYCIYKLTAAITLINK